MKPYASLWEKLKHLFGIHAWQNIHASPLAEEPYQAVCRVCGKEMWPHRLNVAQSISYTKWQKKHSTRPKYPRPKTYA
jgi:hypothetical protein